MKKSRMKYINETYEAVSPPLLIATASPLLLYLAFYPYNRKNFIFDWWVFILKGTDDEDENSGNITCIEIILFI